MADEDIADKIDVEDQEASEEQVFDDVEQEALKHGWKPKDEYEGDPSQWRSAETFMALKPFFERIEEQTKEIKKFKRATTDIMKEVASMRKTEYDRALRNLKAERKSAFDDGDIDRYHQLEDEIDTLKDHQRQATSVPEDPDIDVNGYQNDFIDWKAKNTWYDRDDVMKDWADGRGVKLHQEGMSPNQVLRQLEKEVREKFPHKFENPNRDKAAAVSGSERSTNSSRGKFTMTEDERRIMNTFVKSGVMTEDEYIKEYKKVRGI